MKKITDNQRKLLEFYKIETKIIVNEYPAMIIGIELWQNNKLCIQYEWDDYCIVSYATDSCEEVRTGYLFVEDIATEFTAEIEV